MTEETALLLLEELQLINENFNPIILSVGLIAMLLSMLLGAFLIFIITRSIGRSF